MYHKLTPAQAAAAVEAAKAIVAPLGALVELDEACAEPEEPDHGRALISACDGTWVRAWVLVRDPDEGAG